jgi:hypothetical protein
LGEARHHIRTLTRRPVADQIIAWLVCTIAALAALGITVTVLDLVLGLPVARAWLWPVATAGVCGAYFRERNRCSRIGHYHEGGSRKWLRGF